MIIMTSSYLDSINFKFAVLLLILQTALFSCDALLLKCPLYQLQLQKIVGFRPPLEYLTERNLIYWPTRSFREGNRYTRSEYDPTTLAPTAYGNSNSSSGSIPQHEPWPLASTICWRICNDDDDCIAYVHLLDTDECYGYSYFERTQQHYRAIGEDVPLVPDAEAIFYEKTCLKVPETCKKRLWALTKIPGNSLVFQGKKTIPTLVTRRECSERCLFEHEFKCLSASFAPSYRNNRERFNPFVPPSQHTTLGRCVLSDKDKTIQPDAFRVAPYDEEYIENQCYEREIENDSCSYELYANSSFIYAEIKYTGLTQKECQSYCSHESKFYCQGVSFYYDKRLSTSECLLHAEDIISMGPRSLRQRENSIYMRRVKCLDVQVLCTHEEMAIKYTPRDWFRGKMYVSMHSQDCVACGNGTKSTLLRLQIGNEATEHRCGILRAYEVSQEYQRIFISALVVIQNNANVQTQGDRLIKVGCIMSNSTLKPEDAYNSTNDTEEEQEDVPNAIALESSLSFTQHTLPNEGARHLNISDAPQILPKINLQIIDLSHQHETNDVQIGQNLELQIVAEYTPQQQQQQHFISNELPPLPEFRATSLIAKTQDNQNYVLLIDERGCPTDVTVFPALERLHTRSKSVLRARFHAFKFAGTSMVNFDVKIHFCAQRCPDNNCLQHGNSEQKWRAQRKRRQSGSWEQQQPVFKVQNPVYISTVVDVRNQSEQLNTTQDEDLSKYLQQQMEADAGTLPLNYNLHVRGPDNPASNGFIYGERGILLIAGIGKLYSEFRNELYFKQNENCFCKFQEIFSSSKNARFVNYLCVENGSFFTTNQYCFTDDQMHPDSICLNQSLLLALIIFWLIFQIALLFSCCYVIQKYKRLAAMDEERRKIHESLEYFEGRRVHWADQGGYTL